MAEVDFTNARIEPSSLGNWVNPTNAADVSLNNYSYYLLDSSGSSISSALSPTQLINQQKQLMFLYQGTFTASGTEFYIRPTSSLSGWKVSNISFNSGDTFVFQINATLTCN